MARKALVPVLVGIAVLSLGCRKRWAPPERTPPAKEITGGRVTFGKPPNAEFLEAVKQGDMVALKQHLDADDRPALSAEVDPALGEQWTLLHFAAEAGHADVVALLIEHGAPIRVGEIYGRLPLHLACGNGHVGAAEVLLDAGADPNEDAGGDTNWACPLHFAAGGGHVGVIRLLVDRGADVDGRDQFGRTPLHLACREDHVDVVRELLGAGADPNARDQDRTTPRDVAEQEGHHEALGLLTRSRSGR